MEYSELKERSYDKVKYSSGAIGKEIETSDYLEFVKAKVFTIPKTGFDIELNEINPKLKEHQKLIVQWAVRGGKRGIFAAFGLGKSVIQLEILRIILSKIGGRGLICLPLGVRQEFTRDAKMLGIDVKFVRRLEECGKEGIYLTNYETIRDGKLDPAEFSVASLDEGSVLRSFAGTKTFREFMRMFADVKYRFVATATPSPNEYIELLAYSAFLGIMDVSGAKTRFFKRDSTKADKLTLLPHKEQEFWLWIASWGLFVQKPSDIGCSDEGYALPEMKVIWHEVQPKEYYEGFEKWTNQSRMFRNAALDLSAAAREKKDSLALRIDKMQEIISESPNDNFLLWHDLEVERHGIQKAIPEAWGIWGTLDLEEREKRIIDFSEGRIQYFYAKPRIAGSGCNFQYYCHKSIFLGIGFKFNDFIQAVHRIYRFLQDQSIEIHLIYTEGEREIRKVLERKWNEHNIMREKMTKIIKDFGLSEQAMAQSLIRKLGVERVEVKGENYTLVNNDCVIETKSMAENSCGLILTSIPFSTQYEYSPNYMDFGHSDSNSHFWKQMDFLIPELLRVLQPGRMCCIHVKDRIVPGGMTGLGYQTTYPFHVDCIINFTKHGFGYVGMKTIVTDVVRENNQTYRLGWTEQCKDGTKMGVGMPEYLLYFRKTPTDTSKSYADVPVIKSKEKYSRSRWQIDAHGFTRSSGNRLLRPEELNELSHETIFQLFKDFSLNEVYDFEHHVKIGEELDKQGRLPVTFMLLQPQSWSNEVWTDITRMLTLNGAQSAKGKDMHLCPMQFDLADRVISQLTMEGETVYDPFGGLMTVPYRAVLLGRKGIGVELSPSYFMDGIHYCKAAEYKISMPSLFDSLEKSELEKDVEFFKQAEFA